MKRAVLLSVPLAVALLEAVAAAQPNKQSKCGSIAGLRSWVYGQLTIQLVLFRKPLLSREQQFG